MKLKRGQKAVNVSTETELYVPSDVEVEKGDSLRLSNGRNYEVLGFDKAGILEVITATKQTNTLGV